MTRVFRSAFLMLAILLGCAAQAGAQEFIARQIENLVSTDSLKVKIDGLSGALSGNVRIQSVTVSDPGGPFLTAKDLAMDWSPLGIVRSNVDIQSLTAGQIVLERLPNLPPSPTDQTSSGGLPNITANVQKIAITEFVLGEAVAGTRARLSLDARLLLQADPTRLETDLAIDRLDRPGRIAANIAYAPAENRLGVKVDASEPAGGLVATLLKIPGAPPVQLTVNGSGPLSDFMANGSLNVADQNAAMLTARVSDAPDGRRVTAQLNVAAERFAPEAYQPYVRGGANLDATVLLRPDGVIGIEQAQLSSDAVRLTASGTLDRTGPQTALDIAVASPDGGPIPLRFGEGTGQTVIDVKQLQARLAGALSAANIDLSANLPQAGSGPYAARDLTLKLSSRDFDIDRVSGPLTLEANAASVAMPEGVGERFTRGQVRIAADGALSPESLTLSQSRVTTDAANASVTGTAALNFSTFDLTLAGDFQTLALSAALVPLAGDRTSLSGRVLRDANGTLAAENLAVRSTGLDIDGSARLANETIEADIRGTIDAADTNDAAISGKAEFALTASGPTAQPNLDVSLNSQGLRVNGRELANVKIAARGSFTGENPEGSVDVSGTLDGTPLTGTAKLATLPSGERRITDLAIRQGPNTVTGDLRLTTAVVPVGTLKVDVADIGPLAALALQKVSGDLKGRIDLSVNERDVPVATVDLDSNRLLAAGNTLTGAAVKLAVADYLGKPQPTGTIRVNAVEAGGITVDALAIDLSQAGDGTRLEAKARANGVPVELAGIAGIQPNETSIALEKLDAAIPNAAVSLEQATRVRIANGTTTIDPTVVKVGAGRLRFGGTAGQDLNLTAALEAVPVAVANPFVSNLDASGTLTGDAKVTGTAADPKANFRIAATNVETSQTRAGRLPAIEAQANGDYAGGVLNLAAANVDLGEGSLRANGRVGGEVLQIEATLDKLPVALANGFVGGLDASGAISGTARATGSPAQPNATFDIRGTGITAKDVAAAGVPPIELVANGSYANARLTLAEARATMGQAFLEASGTVGERLDLNARLSDVPVALANGFVPGLRASGTISGSASATGTTADPNATFNLNGTGITAERIAASGIKPLTLDVAGTVANKTATIERGRIDVGDGFLNASGTVGEQLNLTVEANRLPVGLANGFVPDLQAAGTISGNASATGSLSDPTARFQFTGTGLTTRQLKAAQLRPVEFDLSGNYAKGTATIDTARAAIGDGRLNASGTVGRNLKLQIEFDDLPVAIANGFVPDLGARGTLSGTGSADSSIANPVASFDIRANGVTTAQTRAANAPPINAVASGRYENEKLAIRTARVTIGGGTVDITGSAGRELDLDVAIRNLPASLASAAASGIDPTGTLNGTARATGPVSNPAANFDLTLSNFTVRQTRDAGVGALGIRANGEFANRTLRFTTNLTGGSGLNFAANGTVNVEGTPRFDVRANGTAPLSLANRILGESGRAAQGTVRIDVAATGTAAAPNVTGTISTAGATFTDTNFNVALRSINATINLTGQEATIANFRGTLAAGGTISASGTVGLTGGFPANVQIRADNARYADGELVATTLDAALSITGQLTATPLLAGSIDVQKMDILVPSSFPSSLARIDVRYRNAPRAVLKQQRELFPPSAGTGGGGGINLDIAFNAPNRIFVRGRGLDVQMGGSLRIQGSAAAPAITGGFELQRGRLVVLNKRLDFERGRLSFDGELIPLLDFLATSQAGDATINIAVTGPANDPSFNFSSSPALPQDEVLARLIFNQGTTNLSPLQIAQLAEAAAQLAGVGGSTGLLENLRSQIGVDDIDIRTTADGQTAIGVGKYINDRTYLGVDSTGRASINIDIAKGFKARGAVTSEGGGEVGIFYENEY